LNDLEDINSIRISNEDLPRDRSGFIIWPPKDRTLLPLTVPATV
jgi:hypothetical protein